MIKNQTLRAAFWMLGAMLSLLLVSIFGKLLAPSYNSFEIMFYRSILGFLAFLLILAVSGKLRALKIRYFKLHMTRNVIHFTAQNLWFYAIATLPLAMVITFEFTTPAWVIIIAALILGEGFGWRRLLVIILSLIGVVLITNPANAEFNSALMAAILCAIGFAATIITTKKLTKVQNVYEILLVMTVLQGIFAAIIISFLGESFLGELEPIHKEMLPWLIAIGITGTTSHYCMTKSLSLADASIVAPIDLLRLPLSVMVGFLFFGETIGIWALLGSGFLLFANYFNIKRPRPFEK